MFHLLPAAPFPPPALKGQHSVPILAVFLRVFWRGAPANSNPWPWPDGVSDPESPAPRGPQNGRTTLGEQMLRSNIATRCIPDPRCCVPVAPWARGHATMRRALGHRISSCSPARLGPTHRRGRARGAEDRLQQGRARLGNNLGQENLKPPAEL